MVNYRVEIQKCDHIGDLHIHFYKDIKKKRMLIGKYSLPSMEPLQNTNHELSKTERKFIQETLTEKKFRNKLQKALEETFFNLHKMSEAIISNISNGEIKIEKGKTKICVSITLGEELQ